LEGNSNQKKLFSDQIGVNIFFLMTKMVKKKKF